jgi:dCMP deaminase
VGGRPSWDEYYLDIVLGVKLRASCPRRQGGAVIIDDRQRILSTAYNGPPSKLPNCTETPCPGVNEPSGTTNLCLALHAEDNAIHFAGDRIDRADTLYCTTAPCTKCALRILQTPIKRVVYLEGYKDPMGIALLMSAGVQVEAWETQQRTNSRGSSGSQTTGPSYSSTVIPTGSLPVAQDADSKTDK